MCHWCYDSSKPKLSRYRGILVVLSDDTVIADEANNANANIIDVVTIHSIQRKNKARFWFSRVRLK
jgi:hypothetical protein